MSAINFEGKIFAADTETRTLRGLIVPFGQVGNTSAGAVEFHPEAFGQIKAEEIVLNMEHERTKPLGRGIAGSEKITPAGVEMAFKIAPTTAGTDALIEAAEGLRDGFSVGVKVNDWKNEKGVMVVASSDIMEVSLVTDPAIDSARVAEVAASENETSAEAEETPTTESEDAVDSAVTEAQKTEEAVEASAPQPVVTATAPVAFTAPRSPIVNGES